MLRCFERTGRGQPRTYPIPPQHPLRLRMYMPRSGHRSPSWTLHFLKSQQGFGRKAPPVSSPRKEARFISTVARASFCFLSFCPLGRLSPGDLEPPPLPSGDHCHSPTACHHRLRRTITILHYTVTVLIAVVHFRYCNRTSLNSLVSITLDAGDGGGAVLFSPEGSLLKELLIPLPKNIFRKMLISATTWVYKINLMA